MPDKRTLSSLMLYRPAAVLPVSGPNVVAFDPFSRQQVGVTTPEVYVGRERRSWASRLSLWLAASPSD